MLAYGYGYDRLDKAALAGGVAVVGALALLSGETDGFASDFTYSDNAKRVAKIVSSVQTEYEPDAFYSNGGTSPKLIYDSTGTLVWSPHNMILQSEDFTATWTVGGTPVVTAHTVEDNDAGGFEYVTQPVTVITGATYTVSFWILKDAITSRFPEFQVISSPDTTATQVNTSTGAKSDRSLPSGSSTSVEDVGTHWKLKITFVGAGSTALRIYGAVGTVFGAISSAAVGTVTVDKVQVNRGSVPTAYLATTTAARYGLAIDHDPVTLACRGLLVEPAATNLLLRSREFSNAEWGASQMASVALSGTAPDGLATSYKLTPNTVNAGHYIRDTGLTVTATGYAYSGYFKAAGYNYAVLQLASDTSYTAYFEGIFNLSNGTIEATGRAVTYTGTRSIEAIGNGWYRCTITVATATANSTAMVVIVTQSTNDPTVTFAGDGTSGILAYQAQLETGSIATSPIPTFGATVTRAVDDPVFAVSSIPWSATAGLVVIESTLDSSEDTGGNSQSFVYMNTSSTEYIRLYNNDTTTRVRHVQTAIRDDVAGLVTGTESGDLALTPTCRKYGMTWDATDFIGAVDGSLITPASASPATLPTIINFRPAQGLVMPTYVHKVTSLPRRSNADLQTRTA